MFPRRWTRPVEKFGNPGPHAALMLKQKGNAMTRHEPDFKAETPDGSMVAPPGTRLAQRQNLGGMERSLSVAAGAVLAIIGARRRGVAGIALGLASSALLARGASGFGPAKRALGQRPDEKALAESAGWSSAAISTHAVTINAPRERVWQRFTDFEAWPDFAVNVSSLTRDDEGRLHIGSRDPAGEIEIIMAVTERIDRELLALDTVEGAAVPMSVRYEFRDGPPGRGTEIHGTVGYEPPGGSLGRHAAKANQREPGIQLRRDLKRFKALVETGEIATNAPQGQPAKA